MIKGAIKGWREQCPPAESVPGLDNREIAPISSPHGIGVEHLTTLTSPFGSVLVGVIWLTKCSGYECQITGHPIVCLTDYADPHQRNIKARVTGPLWGNSPVISEFPHKGPVTRKKLPFDDVIMYSDVSVMAHLRSGLFTSVLLYKS